MKLFSNICLALPLVLASSVYAESFPCEQGEPSSFILENLSNLAEAPEVVVNDLRMSKFSPDSHNQIQLDVCVEGDEKAELKTLHILDQGQRYKATKILSVEGLAPALFGDVSALSLVVELPGSEGLVYAVKGLTKDGSSLVSAMPLRGEEAIDDRALVGDLVYGEAEIFNQGASAKCTSDESERQETFKIVDATITGTICTKITSDRSTSIRFVEATLVDVIDGKEFRHEFKAADFSKEGSFRYSWTHHNLDDQLYIKTSEGVYQSKRGTGDFFDVKTGTKSGTTNTIRHSIGWVPMGIAQRITYMSGEEKIARDSNALSILSVDNK